MPSLDVDWPGFPSSDSFGDRDASVLSIVDEEALSTFSFDGLKRRLGLHPETLSRILDRLEEEGIVKKTREGYEVTPKITKLKVGSARREGQTVSLLQTFLPTNVPIQNLLSTLKGRWFGVLRWFGMSETSEGVMLKWITEDGSIQIAASISGTSLKLDAKFLTSNNLDLALRAAYQLMAQIGRLCNITRSATHVAYCSSEDYGYYFTLS